MFRRFSFIVLAAMAATVFAVDQWLKYLMFEKISSREVFSLAAGFLKFNLTPTLNAHLAFGLRPGQVWQWAIISLALIALIIFTVYQFRSPVITHGEMFAYGALLGAATSNFFDRIVREGVVDFLALSFGDFSWPTFNLADAILFLTASYLFLMALKKK